MKKLSYLLLAALFLIGVCHVNAMTEDQLYDALTQKITINGKKWGVDEKIKSRIKRFLDENEVSSKDADYINTQIDVAIKILKEAGTTDPKKMTAKQKQDLKDLAANVTRNTTSVKATVENGQLIVKNANNVEYFRSDDGLVKYTGTDANVVAIVAGLSLLIVAAGSVLIVKQVKQN